MAGDDLRPGALAPFGAGVVASAVGFAVLVLSGVTWFGDVEPEIKASAMAQEFGNESEHFVFVIPDHMKSDEWQEIADMPETFESQIRTLFMHAWAEPQHDLGYKGDPDPEVKRELAWIAASAWGADRTLNEVARKLSAENSGELT